MFNPQEKEGKGDRTVVMVDKDGTLTGRANSITAPQGIYFLVIIANVYYS